MNKTIAVFKNNISLIDVQNEIDTPNQQTGEPNKKICVWINNYANKEQHKNQKGVGAYLDVDEAKLIFSDLADGTFAKRIHNTKEVGKYTKIGGVAQARIFTVHAQNGMIEFSVAIHHAEKGNNGSTKPGVLIDKHSVKLNTFNTRKLAMSVRDFINQKQLMMMIGQGIPVTTPKEVVSYEQAPQETVPYTPQANDDLSLYDNAPLEDDDVYVENPFSDGTTINEAELDEILGIAPPPQEETPPAPVQNDENDPILPSGKYKGKRLSEMNDSYKNWVVENAKGQHWEVIKQAILGGQA